MEFYKAFRPRKLSEVVGQEVAVKTIENLLKRDQMPHALLLSGPSGCGKTTVARILKDHLKVNDADFTGLNSADFRGIETVRDIRRVVGLAPMFDGGNRMWLIDEVHKMTSDGQHSFLNLLEEGAPAHAYFVLATTDPGKLLTTIRTRCTEVKLSAIKPEVLAKLCDDVIARYNREKKGKLSVTEDVRDKVVEMADGSARKALVLLDQVVGFSSEEEQLEALEKADDRVAAVEIARALFRYTPWKEMASVLRNVDEDVESLRRMVLGYASQVMLKGGKGSTRAADVIEAFQGHFYDSGRPGFNFACYQLCAPQKR